MRRPALVLLSLIVSCPPPLRAEAPRVDVPPLRFELPRPERVVLSNGLPVYIAEDNELPLFNFRLRLRSSPAYEPHAGAFSLLSAVWRNGGTKTRSPAAVNLELERMAAEVSIAVGWEEVTLAASCLAKDRDATLALLADLLFNPAFSADQLSLAKQRDLEEIRRKNETPAQIGRRAFRDVIYGPDHPYARDATEESIAAVKRKTLQQMHRVLAVPDQGVLSVAGDFKKEQMLALLEKMFAGWRPTGRSVPPFDYPPDPRAAGEVFVVDKTASQSRITLGRLGITRHHPDYFPLKLADHILGGGGPSRLFAEIRSRRGLAYVVGSFFTDPPGTGMAGVVCQTQAETSAQAVTAIIDVLKEFAKAGPTAEEVKVAKDSIIQSFVFGFESPTQIVDGYATLEFYGYPANFYETYRERVAGVTAEEIRRVSRLYFSPDGMKIVIAGDTEKFRKELETVGTVVELPLSSID